MKPQFSIRSLLWLLTFLALSCALLAKPSFFAAGVVWSVSMAVLAMAVVAAVARRGDWRAFWATFAFIGWGHMILALAPWFDDHTGELILSRQLLDALGHVLGHDVADIRTMPGVWRNLSYAHDSNPTSASDYLTYVVVGQSIITLLLACIAGLFGKFLFATRDPNPSTSNRANGLPPNAKPPSKA